MKHYYRVPPIVTGDIRGSAPFSADTAIAAIAIKREKCIKERQPFVAARVTSYSLQVYYRDRWLMAALVPVSRGGMATKISYDVHRR